MTCIIIPAYNEDIQPLHELLESLAELGYALILIDDGSEPAVPVHAGVYLIRHQRNLGQGAALQAGMDKALALGATYAVHFDADGQHRPADLPALLEPLYHGECDVVLGSRFLQKESIRQIPWPRRQLLRMARLYQGIVLGIWLSDAHNGLRAMNARALRAIRLYEPGRAHASEFVLALRAAGLRYREAAVCIRYPAFTHKKPPGAWELIKLAWQVAMMSIRYKKTDIPQT